MLHFTLNSLIIDEIELYRKYRKKVSKYILLGKNVGTRRRERGNKQKSNEKVNDYFERIVKEGYS